MALHLPAVRSTIGLELVIRVVYRLLPAGLRRAMAGRPVTIDGQRLDPDLQLLLRLERMTAAGTPASTLHRRREHLDIATALVGGRRLAGVDVTPIWIPRPADSSATDPVMPARLYTPTGLPAGSPLLVYAHGGGWVTGGLDSHDAVCRYLAVHAGVRVLAVAYRLAPENPFPAGVVDMTTAYRFARSAARRLGADPDAVALGGDSAGGNLAAVTAYLAARAGQRVPEFLLLFYPACDAVNRTASRELFGKDFLLTDEDITWFCDHYLPPGVDRADPSASILLAEDLSGMPPTYLATAGFDPLRDEGESFAGRLRAAGVPVVMERHTDLVHGFVNMIGVSPRCREAVAAAAAAVRAGLAVRWCPRSDSN